MTAKLRNTRFFLCSDADSYVKLEVPDDGYRKYTLKLADCDRNITWYIPRGKKGVRKLKKFKALIDALYAELDKSA
jgi:hypothetical protein